MSNPFTGKTSPNTAGWVLAAVFFGWLAFIVLVDPRPKPPPPPYVPPAEPSRLAAFGLEDNPDWDGLPGIFSVWADRMTWQDGRTTFAYWSPATADYSYVFEATRAKGAVHFRRIPPPRGYDPRPAVGATPPEHPLRFFAVRAPVPPADPTAAAPPTPESPGAPEPSRPNVVVDVPSARIDPAKPAPRPSAPDPHK